MKVKRYTLQGTIEDNLAVIQDILREQLHQGVSDVKIRELAEAIIREAQIPARDYLGEITALTNWVRANTRYTRDPYGSELIRHPRRLAQEFLEIGQMQSDCEESATLLASLLGSLGHNPRLVLVDANPFSNEISHAMAQVEYPTNSNRWLWLETTRNLPIGQVVAKHTREIIIE